MRRSLSTGKRTIDQRVIDNNYESHMRRLYKIKATTSQTALLQKDKNDFLKEAMILKSTNPKKEVQKELYFIKVEKENKLLLDKISNIVYSKPQKQAEIPQTFRVKSLNEVNKKKEIGKIINDNVAIVQRIQQQKTIYDIKKWENEFIQRSGYLRNITEFKVFKGIKSSFNKTSKSTIYDIEEPKKRSASVSDFKQNRDNLLFKCEQEQSITGDISRRKLIGKRRLILFKTLAKIGSHCYSVEFSLANQKFQISVVNKKGLEPSVITLDEDTGKKLIEDHHNDYNHIVAKLDFKDNKLFLDWAPIEKQKEASKIELFENNLFDIASEPQEQNNNNTDTKPPESEAPISFII